jgi:hypothetical protein
MSDFLFLKDPVAANHTVFRPIDIVFSQDGTAMYLADWGNLLEPGVGAGGIPQTGVTIPQTGVIWKITPVAGDQTSNAMMSPTSTKGSTGQ